MCWLRLGVGGVAAAFAAVFLNQLAGPVALAGSLHACPGADTAYDKLDYDTARQGYTLCIERGQLPEEELPDLFHRRGRSEMKMGDHDAALADFDRALAIDEIHAEALNSRAWVLLLKGLPEGALPDIEAARVLQPADARIADSYAHVLAALGRSDEALKAFELALSLQSRQEIAKLQENLRAAGYDAGPSDGEPGQKTREALAACVRDRCIIWR